MLGREVTHLDLWLGLIAFLGREGAREEIFFVSTGARPVDGEGGVVVGGVVEEGAAEGGAGGWWWVGGGVGDGFGGGDTVDAVWCLFLSPTFNAVWLTQ